MTSKRLMTVAAIAAVTAGVLGSSHAAFAYSNDAVKRAIVTIVLKNLGVEPSASIVDALVADLPIDALSSNLVDQVGSALDAGNDPTLIIGQTVDSDGDGVPNENAAIDAEDDHGTETDDDSDSSDDTSTSSGGGSKPSGNNANETNNDTEGPEDQPDEDNSGSTGDDSGDEDEGGPDN